MKRIAGVALLTALLLAALLWSPDPVSTQVRNAITPAVLQGRAWVFAALQTFDVGATIKADSALTDPSALSLTASAGDTTGGSCSSTVTYRYYFAWENPTGQTALSAASADFTPSSGTTNKVTLTRPAIPVGQGTPTAWRAYFRRSTDGYAALEGCGSLGVVTSVPYATSTFDCLCSTLTNPSPPTNTTRDVTLADTGVTSTGIYWRRPELSQIKEVCSFGCEFKTASEALASISDASTSKRYGIVVHAPHTGETITLKSYVSIIGTVRETVRFNSILIPADGTDIGIDNLSVVTDIKASSPGNGGTVWVTDITCGTTAGGNIDCIFDLGGGYVWRVSGSTLYSNFDAVALNYEGATMRSEYHGAGNVYRIIAQASLNAACWAIRGPALVRDAGSLCTITGSGTQSADGTALYGAHFGHGYETGAGDSLVYDAIITGATISIRTSDPNFAPRAACLSIPTTKANGGGTVVFNGVDCSIAMADIAGTHNGIYTAFDTDHANWGVQWNGGRIAVSGGATQDDVNHNETAASFALSIHDVLHAGIYTGAGSFAVDAPLTNQGRRLSPRATAPSTCSIGDRYSDTSGADCFCSSTNTWTNTIGVGSCV